jgi:hypothetical protein
VLVGLVVLAAYGGDVGRAFIKEDANWIIRSRIEDASDVARLVTDTGGFFRPVVGLSFAVNHWMFRGAPAGYGWTNLLLACGVALALFRLARVLGLGSAAATLAASLWILNFHGITMGLLWLSGRTALLLSLFSVLAATAAAQQRIFPMAVCALLAMASKEEGVLLPVILIAVVWLRPQGPPPRDRLAGIVSSLVVVWIVYGVVRFVSDAYTPANAPAFYTFSTEPRHLWGNAIEYADRALTLSAGVTVIALAIGGRWVKLSDVDRRLVLLGGVWLAAGFALTILLPARSSLYALFPSIGGALASATVLGAAWSSIPVRRQGALAILALVLPVTFVPVYWQRNKRWTELADISSETIATFRALAPSAPQGWRVIILDDRSTRANVASALGWGLTDTVELVTGRRPHVWIVPPPPDINPVEIVTSPERADAVLELRESRLVRRPSDGLTVMRAGEYW